MGRWTMPERKLKVIKRTPIALALCERCDAEFQSYERIEDEAERAFRWTSCEDAAKTRAGKKV